MPRPLLRLRSPLFVLGALLAGSLFGAGCKQGIGDRCEVARDCETDFCSLTTDPQNGICCDPTNTQTCIVQGGTGGAQGSIGGTSGQGGSDGGDSGQGGSGGATADASTDAPADAPADAASTD